MAYSGTDYNSYLLNLRTCEYCSYVKLLRNPFCKEPSFDEISYSGNAYNTDSSEEMELGLDLFG